MQTGILACFFLGKLWTNANPNLMLSYDSNSCTCKCLSYQITRLCPGKYLRKYHNEYCHKQNRWRHSSTDCKTAKDRIKLKCFSGLPYRVWKYLRICCSSFCELLDSLINNSCARYFTFNNQTVHLCFLVHFKFCLALNECKEIKCFWGIYLHARWRRRRKWSIYVL